MGARRFLQCRLFACRINSAICSTWHNLQEWVLKVAWPRWLHMPDKNSIVSLHRATVLPAAPPAPYQPVWVIIRHWSYSGGILDSVLWGRDLICRRRRKNRLFPVTFSNLCSFTRNSDYIAMLMNFYWRKKLVERFYSNFQSLMCGVISEKNEIFRTLTTPTKPHLAASLKIKDNHLKN